MEAAADEAIAMLLRRFPRATPSVQPRQPSCSNALPFLDPYMLLTLPWARIANRLVSESALFQLPAMFFGDHPLAACSVKESTHKAYYKALQTLEVEAEGFAVTFGGLDAFLEAYANDVFADESVRVSKQQIVNIMCATVFRVPSISEHFRNLRRALRGWSRQSTPKQALPLTRQLSIAFVGFFLRGNETSMALCVAIMWGALLRAREAVALRFEDRALPGDPRLSDCAPGTAGVLVRSGKTGPMQVSLIDDVLVCSLLSAFFCPDMPPRQGRIFPLSYGQLLTGMRRAATHFELDGSQVSTHSCRHGGALTLFFRGVPASTIATRGRWLSARTLETYFRNGRATLLRMSYTNTAKLRIDTCSEVVAQALGQAGPPS